MAAGSYCYVNKNFDFTLQRPRRGATAYCHLPTAYSFNISLAMISFWISVVPS